MKMSRSLGRSLAAAGVALSISLTLAFAQTATNYQPREGQSGKDVVWVPTSQALVDKLLDTAKVTSDDYVMDLGSGDGRMVITAARRGATAHGIEYNPDMVALSRRNAEKAGVKEKATFERGDIFRSDFSKATVITLFLLSDLNLRLRPTILNLKPGTRVVSNTFDMGDWEPDETVRATEDCERYCTGYFWVVPAKVEGTWQLPEGELALQQQYQKISGTLRSENGALPINGKLNGNRITFTAGEREFTGVVNGNTIEGTSTWRAMRKEG